MNCLLCHNPMQELYEEFEYGEGQVEYVCMKCNSYLIEKYNRGVIIKTTWSL